MGEKVDTCTKGWVQLAIAVLQCESERKKEGSEALGGNPFPHLPILSSTKVQRHDGVYKDPALPNVFRRYILTVEQLDNA